MSGEVIPGGFSQGEIVEEPVFVSRATRPRQPTKAERLFSSAVYAAQQLHREGLAVTADTLKQWNPELPAELCRTLFGSDKFLHALEERGIPVPGAGTGLTPEQLHVAAIFMDTTTPMTFTQKLRAAGITRAKWNGWMRQPAFAEHVAALSEEALKDAVPVALQRISQHVDAGNLKAIELALEMTGRHDRRQEQLDVNKLLMAVFTVLDEEIAPLPGGTEVMTRIAGKVKAMMAVNQGQPTIQLAPSRPTLGGADGGGDHPAPGTDEGGAGYA